MRCRRFFAVLGALAAMGCSGKDKASSADGGVEAGGPEAAAQPACPECKPGADYQCPGYDGGESHDITIVDQIDGGCTAIFQPGTSASIQCNPLTLCINTQCQPVQSGDEHHLDNCTR